MASIPHIPETAPFTAEQRAWLNGFLAGLFGGLGAAEAAAANSTPAPPGEPLLVLFGSQTGTAEGLAKRIAGEAAQRGFAPRILALNDCEPATLADSNKALIISSTWGDGDPPDNATSFWSWLNSPAAPRLERLNFGVLGLGDRNYGDFCGASKKFDARLEALGAHRLVPRGECDVDYEAAAKSWLESLWDRLKGAPATNGHSHPLNGSLRDSGIVGSPPGTGAPAPQWNRSRPFPARLLRNLPLNKPGSGKEVRHYEISLGESGLAYEAGDALGVMPVNCPALVGDVLAAMRCTGREQVTVGTTNLPLSEALARHFDLRKPTPELLAAVAGSAPDAELAGLLFPERAAELREWLHGREVVDILVSSPTVLAPGELLPLLRRLAPRLYSIASSPKAHPGEVHLTVSAVRYESHGRPRKGVASTFLADRAGASKQLPVFVQPSHAFKPPADSGAPMIMVGPGTGIAPFRAFLEERQAVGAQGKNWLFFGDQKRATDFLYEEQLTGWLQERHLARLDLAFSRDQSEKVYVQDRMLEQAPDLWAWLEEGAHFYVCGDASRMAKDVEAALHTVVEQRGAKSPDEARQYVARLKAEHRYQRDVY